MAKKSVSIKFSKAVISKEDNGKYTISEILKDDSTDYDLSELLDNLIGTEGISISITSEDEIDPIEQN